LLKDEIDRTLAQIGCPSVSDLSPDYVMADGSMPTTAPRLREEIDTTMTLLGSEARRDLAEKQSATSHQR
jgi:isopentenyl diphosphate isomerase/L-lactate dehydrogenase-like FMN-dependent dehydrogenase